MFGGNLPNDRATLNVSDPKQMAPYEVVLSFPELHRLRKKVAVESFRPQLIVQKIIHSVIVFLGNLRRLRLGRVSLLVLCLLCQGLKLFL
jgi:hypothetical protein